jgi:hypothetical protein
MAYMSWKLRTDGPPAWLSVGYRPRYSDRQLASELIRAYSSTHAAALGRDDWVAACAGWAGMAAPAAELLLAEHDLDGDGVSGRGPSVILRCHSLAP